MDEKEAANKKVNGEPVNKSYKLEHFNDDGNAES